MGESTVVVRARVLESNGDDEPKPTEPPRFVALKVMREHTATSSADAVDAFTERATEGKRLKSKHAPEVYEVETLASGLPFIAMELLEGNNLAELLDRDGIMRSYVAIDYVLQACDALGEADRLNMPHGDLRPANLFLARQRDAVPIIKVLDFGLSRIRALSPARGIPFYKAPEQLHDDDRGPPDGRTDVWALGAILFELVTGHRPFAGDTREEVESKILERPPPQLEAYLQGPPPGLGAVIHRCLEKERTKRYVTVGAFALALSELGVKPSISISPSWSGPRVDPVIESLAAGIAETSGVARPQDPGLSSGAKRRDSSTPPLSTHSPAPLPKKKRLRPALFVTLAIVAIAAPLAFLQRAKLVSWVAGQPPVSATSPSTTPPPESSVSSNPAPEAGAAASASVEPLGQQEPRLEPPTVDGSTPDAADGDVTPAPSARPLKPKRHKKKPPKPDEPPLPSHL